MGFVIRCWISYCSGLDPARHQHVTNIVRVRELLPRSETAEAPGVQDGADAPKCGEEGREAGPPEANADDTDRAMRIREDEEDIEADAE